MKTLNVIDLDGALLPYDSARRFVWLLLGRPRILAQVVQICILTFLGRIDARTFLEKVLRSARSFEDQDQRMRVFAERLYRDLDPAILERVREETDEDTVNVLCTAAPEDYVKYLAKHLAWQYVCSTLEEGSRLVRMYGDYKLAAIERAYPREQYRYNFAISDSASDDRLLAAFSVGVRVGR